MTMQLFQARFAQGIVLFKSQLRPIFLFFFIFSFIFSFLLHIHGSLLFLSTYLDTFYQLEYAYTYIKERSLSNLFLMEYFK